MEVVYVRICVDISRQYIILPVEINLSFTLFATHFRHSDAGIHGVSVYVNKMKANAIREKS